ncbi:unnamed protein product, partial [Urochloa humidicola]
PTPVKTADPARYSTHESTGMDLIPATGETAPVGATPPARFRGGGSEERLLPSVAVLLAGDLFSYYTCTD